ncbi:MAG: type IV secretion system protein [Thermomonas sp.]|uniref:type IV secretion system protein n=1 Tax=Thermomonas sp. TaxID=1971895 RepID=UPI0039E25976
MNACPVIPGGDAASLSGTLAAVDCQLNGAVGVAYARLFGQSGAFVTTLTVVLTLYVALLALGLVSGRTRLTLSGAMPRVFALGLVLTFATAWPAYQVVVSDLLARGPDQIASALLGGGGSATATFVHRLDGLFTGYVELAQALQAQGQQASANLQLSAKLAWAGSLLLVLSTAGLLVMARVVLAILLALGPVFIVFALFGGTRGLFEGWLKTVVAFALAPMLIVLGGAGLVAMLSPLLDEAMADPLAAGEAVRPLAMLFVAAVIYLLTLLALAWAAASLTRHWRLASTRDAGMPHAPHPQPDRPAATAPATSSAHDRGNAADGRDLRVASIGNALQRGQAGSGGLPPASQPMRTPMFHATAAPAHAQRRATQRWGQRATSGSGGITGGAKP